MSEQKTVEQLYREVSNIVTGEELDINRKKTLLLNFYSVLYPRLLEKVGLSALDEETVKIHENLTQTLNVYHQVQNSLLTHMTEQRVYEFALRQQQQAAPPPQESQESILE